MATSQSGQSDKPPYRSYDELRKDDVYAVFSRAIDRLFWRLDGVFPSALSVMKTRRSPNDLEPYFQPEAGGSGSGTWHEISQLPLTEPKVSSVEISVADLEQWESDWIEWHRDHAGDKFGSEYVTYGDLSDEDRPYAKDPKEDGTWEEEEDTEFLIKCCGEDRPLRMRGIRLVVTRSAGNDFVTVHDYVSAAHPWLMSLREDILKAKTVARPQPYNALTPHEWIVAGGEMPENKIAEKEGWLARHGGGPPPTAAMRASNARILERIRASRNG